MDWQIELSEGAIKNLKQLDHQHARRILSFLHGRVAQLDDPRSIGEALKGSKLGELWKYRVGDYRIIADIEDNHHLPQKALGHEAPVQALKKWKMKAPDLFVKSVRNHPGPDI